MQKVILNGKPLDATTNIVSAHNRGLRYGDGCFETMRMVNGKIPLAELHFERLFTSIEALGFDVPKYLTAKKLLEEVTGLAYSNDCTTSARIRLMMFRNNGGLYDAVDHHPSYVIEAESLSVGTEINPNGLVVDFYTAARKTADNFSHIKSNNMLPYVQAAIWAKENKLSDALLLNPFEKLADATIANVFIVQDGTIKTPSLKDGCVGGIMRKHLLKSCKEAGLPVEEATLTMQDVLQAQEVFLSNAVKGIRWVKQVGTSHYQLNVAEMLHNKFIKPLFG